MRKLRVHALRPGLTGEARTGREATLCADPRWQVSEACGDPVTCLACLRERARQRVAKTEKITPPAAPASRAGRAA